MKAAGDRSDVWYATIDGKSGFVHTRFLREYKIHHKNPEVVLALEETKVQLAVQPDKVKQPHEVFEGTTIFATEPPQPQTQPDSTISPVVNKENLDSIVDPDQPVTQNIPNSPAENNLETFLNQHAISESTTEASLLEPQNKATPLPEANNPDTNQSTPPTIEIQTEPPMNSEKIIAQNQEITDPAAGVKTTQDNGENIPPTQELSSSDKAVSDEISDNKLDLKPEIPVNDRLLPPPNSDPISKAAGPLNENVDQVNSIPDNVSSIFQNTPQVPELNEHKNIESEVKDTTKTETIDVETQINLTLPKEELTIPSSFDEKETITNIMSDTLQSIIDKTTLRDNTDASVPVDASANEPTDTSVNEPVVASAKEPVDVSANVPAEVSTSAPPQETSSEGSFETTTEPQALPLMSSTESATTETVPVTELNLQLEPATEATTTETVPVTELKQDTFFDTSTTPEPTPDPYQVATEQLIEEIFSEATTEAPSYKEESTGGLLSDMYTTLADMWPSTTESPPKEIFNPDYGQDPVKEDNQSEETESFSFISYLLNSYSSVMGIKEQSHDLFPSAGKRDYCNI